MPHRARGRRPSTPDKSDLAEPTVKPLRAVLFIDYENARNAAVDLFERATDNASDRRKLGHFHPWALGKAIRDQFNRNAGPAGKQPGRDLLLTQVRVYCGVPDPDWHPNGHVALRAHNKRVSVWQDPPRRVRRRSAQVEVEVIAHSLQYPAARYSSSRERKEFVEKEVDTSIAMDVVSSTKVECDVAILWTEDGDLRPAVRYVIERSLRGHAGDGVQIHVAGWRRKKRKRILAPDRHGDKWPDGYVLREHLMSRSTYAQVKDETDYEAPYYQRDAEYLEGRRRNEEPVNGRLVRISRDGEHVIVHVDGTDVTVSVPFRNLIGGRRVGEQFHEHKRGVRRFTVQFVVPRLRNGRHIGVRAELIEYGVENWRWSALQALHDAGTVIKGRVERAINGGLLVPVEGVEAFVPVGQLVGSSAGSNREQNVARLREYEGRTLLFTITNVNRKNSSVTLSEFSVPAAPKYEYGQFVVGMVVKWRTNGAGVSVNGQDPGFVEEGDFLGERPRDVVAEGDLVPLLVSNASRSGGPLLSMRNVHAQAEQAGWKLDARRGAVVIVPDAARELFAT